MNGWPDLENVLARFRDWWLKTQAAVDALDAGRDSAAAVGVPPSAPAQGDGAAGSRAVGLLELVQEFTALRHELKLQTKGVRGLEEHTEAVLAGLREAIAQFRTVQAREDEAANRAATPMVEALVDLDESLRRGSDATEIARRRVLLEDPDDPLRRELESLWAAQAPWRRWLGGRWDAAAWAAAQRRAAELHRELFDSLVEGYAMVRSRLDRAMRKEGIRRIEVVGCPVDPHTMTVVEVVDAPEHPPGTVLDEVRPGYWWKDEVFRFAEVRAVRERNV